MVIAPQTSASGSHKKSLLSSAIELALRDFAVFPLIPNTKSPAISGGFKSATKEPEQLMKWFSRAEKQNIGAATGSPSGFWVLDVDIKKGAQGFESLRALEKMHGPIPPTLVVTTTSGGKHLYFKYSPEMGVRNRAALLPGIDVRGEGGYVVVPPSIVDGSSYTWDDPTAPIANAPDWLLALVRGKPASLTTAASNSINEGCRNTTLMQLAQKQMRKGHGIDAVTDSMLVINAQSCNPPLDDYEVTTIVKNVFRLYDEEIELHCTELGSAQRMARSNKGKLRFVVETRQWLSWNGNLWQPIDENRVYAAAKEISAQLHDEASEIVDLDRRARLKKHAFTLETRKGLDNMIKLLESEKDIATHVGDLDQHGYLLPVKNGVVDLKTGKHAPPDQSLLLTHGTDVPFDATATCPQWEQFLREVMKGDHELVTYVWRAIGYNLTDRTTEQKLFFLHGFGANGKSTFLNILRALLGDLGTQAAGETVLESKRNSSGPSGDIARLRGKRLVAISELDDGKHLAEAMVKSLTGGDAITARHLYGRDFTFTPVAKFWIAANHQPTIKGNDNGIWRRIKMIPFLATFSEAKQDKDLERKLMAELPGILNWAIAGCMDWQKNGLPDATAIKNATKEYRSKMDVLALWLDECAVVGKKYEVVFADAYESFKPWGETNYNCEYSGIKFGKFLTERGFEKTKRPHRGYKGLQLREGFGAMELRQYDKYKGIVSAITSIDFKPEESEEK